MLYPAKVHPESVKEFQMPRISKSGGAGMIGGVRSPMATSGHGLVAKGPTSMYRRGIDNVTNGRKSMSAGTSVKSPQRSADNV
jgi:hypothetical protein